MRTFDLRLNFSRGTAWRRCLTGLAVSALSVSLARSENAAPPAAVVIEPPANEADATLLASPTTRDHIGRVVIPVMVNGSGPYRFIVDTGASHSTISPALAQKLGLQPANIPSILLNGITGTSEVTAVSVEQLQAGDLILKPSALPVVWAPVMAGADGILGAAGLSDKSLVVDFLHNRVVIAGTVESGMRQESLRIHATRTNDGLIMLETRVGGVRVRSVIDTGSQRTLGNLALRDALNARSSLGAARMTSVYGATKEIESGEVQVAPTIAIQSLRISDVELVYGDFHIFKVWGIQDVPAMIIGMDVLGTVATMGIDFKHQDVYLSGAKLTGDPLAGVRTYSAERAHR